MKSFDDALNDLIKAGRGEGSRGGKIIGHTRSGKPIYQNQNKPNPIGELSRADHAKLAKKHYKAEEAARERRDWADEDDSHEKWIHHERMNHGSTMEYEHDPSGRIPGPKDADGDPEYMMSHNSDHDDWYNNLSGEDRGHYLKLHPDSKYLESGTPKIYTKVGAKKKSLLEGDLSKSTALGVDEIKVDEESIGRTRSGKSIYGDSKHPGHKDFSDQDRKDAIKVHKTLQASAANKEESDKHRQSKREHANLIAKKSVDQALDDLIKAGTGEGSRGGKIIGHTRSGKPIYQDANHADHSSFTKQDHKNAATLRMKLSDEADDKAKLYGSPEGDEHFVAAQHHLEEASKKTRESKPKPSKPERQHDQRDFDHRDRLNDIDDGDRKSRGWDTSDGKKHAKALDTGKETYTSSDGIKRRTRDNTSDGWQG